MAVSRVSRVPRLGLAGWPPCLERFKFPHRFFCAAARLGRAARAQRAKVAFLMSFFHSEARRVTARLDTAL